MPQSSSRVLVRLCVAGLIAVTLVVVGPAAGASARPGYVRLLAGHLVYATPSPGAHKQAFLPASDPYGQPDVVWISGVKLIRRVGWMHVHLANGIGWILAASTARASQPHRGLAIELGRLISSVGGRSGAVVAAADGVPLYETNKDTPDVLASNTKLFTAAVGLHVFGPAIAPLLERMLPPSDNVLAQNLSDRVGGGSSARGAYLAQHYALALGAIVHLVDGSGLDLGNQASPLQMVRFLLALRGQSNFELLRRALPVAGRSGNLSARMRGSPAAGHCAAKPGTLQGVSTLSGYCTTRQQGVVVFSILMNNVDVFSAQAAQDQIAGAIVTGR